MSKLQRDDDTLRVAARAVRRVDHASLGRTQLLVEREHRSARRIHVPASDVEHTFGQQQIGDRIHLVYEVVEDLSNQRLLAWAQHDR